MKRQAIFRPAFGLACVGLAWVLATGLAARADLLSLWRLDETSGTVAPNAVTGAFDGTLVNGPVWTWDGNRGQVLWFDGSNAYVDAVGIPPIAIADDFTVSFWARSEQGVNSAVILGNRFGGANNSWAKFTPAQFEYHPNNINNHIDYADIPANQWIYHTVVKDGATLTYYRDGVLGGTATVTSDMPQLPFYMGGDAGGERWRGRLNDVALFDEVLTPAQILTIRSGDFSAFGVAGPPPLPKATSLTDAFDGSALDAGKWRVVNQGLESVVDAGYNAPAVGGGTLTLGGTTNFSYWAGKSVASQDAFDAPAGGELRFSVDRVSLSGAGTAYRSSMWLYADADHYVHFAQDVNEGGWQYNAANSSPTGSGNNLSRADGLDGDLGNHRMTMAHDGQFVKMYLDGRWLASQPANFNQDMYAMLTGQARQAGDSVTAVFDNASVSQRTFRRMYDNFNSGSIDPGKWNVLLKGLENQGSFPGNLSASVQNGELVFQGATGAQYWYGVTLQSTQTFSPSDTWTFVVDRDALDRSGSAARSSLWIWADDSHFLSFAQDQGENGWQYNYSDGGGGAPGGGGVDIAAFNALDGDPGFHEMQLVVRPQGSQLAIDMYLDGQLGATRLFDNWGGLDYHLMLSGMPRASGDSVFAAFDNVQAWAPEPSAWMLAVFGLGALAAAGWWRKRRRPATEAAPL